MSSLPLEIIVFTNALFVFNDIKGWPMSLTVFVLFPKLIMASLTLVGTTLDLMVTNANYRLQSLESRQDTESALNCPKEAI